MTSIGKAVEEYLAMRRPHPTLLNQLLSGRGPTCSMLLTSGGTIAAQSRSCNARLVSVLSRVLSVNLSRREANTVDSATGSANPRDVAPRPDRQRTTSALTFHLRHRSGESAGLGTSPASSSAWTRLERRARSGLVEPRPRWSELRRT